MAIFSLTKISIQSGLQKKEMTWGALGFLLGANSNLLPAMKKTLENGDVYNFDGVYLSTNFELSKHQMN